jgi:hypothetical protein
VSALLVALAMACGERRARTEMPPPPPPGPNEALPEVSEPPPEAPARKATPNQNLFIEVKADDLELLLTEGCTSSAFKAARAPAVALATWADANSWVFCATSSAEGEPTLYLVREPNGGGQAQFFPKDDEGFQSQEGTDVSITLTAAPVGEIVTGEYTAKLTNVGLDSSFVLQGAFRVRRLPDDPTLDARLAPQSKASGARRRRPRPTRHVSLGRTDHDRHGREQANANSPARPAHHDKGAGPTPTLTE